MSAAGMPGSIEEMQMQQQQVNFWFSFCWCRTSNWSLMYSNIINVWAASCNGGAKKYDFGSDFGTCCSWKVILTSIDLFSFNVLSVWFEYGNWIVMMKKIVSFESCSSWHCSCCRGCAHHRCDKWKNSNETHWKTTDFYVGAIRRCWIWWSSRWCRKERIDDSTSQI